MSGVILGAALCGLVGQTGATVPPQTVDGQIDWIYDYEKARHLARTSGKPLFVVFRCER